MKVFKSIVLAIAFCGMPEVVKAMHASQMAVKVVPAAQASVAPTTQPNTQVGAQAVQYSTQAQLRRNSRSCGLALIWITLASLLQSAKAQLWF